MSSAARFAAAHDMGWEDVVSEASRKRAERGGFDHRIFLEYVEQTRRYHGSFGKENLLSWPGSLI
jgi:hypothetical protein